MAPHHAWPCSLYPTPHPACPTTLGLPSESWFPQPCGAGDPLAGSEAPVADGVCGRGPFRQGPPSMNTSKPQEPRTRANLEEMPSVSKFPNPGHHCPNSTLVGSLFGVKKGTLRM